MKTKIEALAYDHVRITYEDDWYNIIEREFRAMPGGYVLDQDGKQPCDRLARTGNTLSWNRTEPLVDLIRREYRAMRGAGRYKAERNR